MNKDEILQAANIPEEWRDACYIAEDGTIFTPRIDENGDTLATGEEVWTKYQAGLSQPPEPALDERVAATEAAVLELMGGNKNV